MSNGDARPAAEGLPPAAVDEVVLVALTRDQQQLLVDLLSLLLDVRTLRALRGVLQQAVPFQRDRFGNLRRGDGPFVPRPEREA